LYPTLIHSVWYISLLVDAYNVLRYNYPLFPESQMNHFTHH
jgi:hypothetical protein